MEPILKTSETAKNLMRAFAGESQARNRYTFAAHQRQKRRAFPSSRRYSSLQPIRRRNTQNCFTNFYRR